MFIFRWLVKFFCLLGKILSYLSKAFIAVISLALMVGIGYFFLSSGQNAQVLPHSILVLDLQGNVHELATEQPFSLNMLGASPVQDTALHEVVAALKQAESDPLIDAVLLKLDKLDRAGIDSVRELGLALNRFKKTGKPVWAWATNFTQAQYAIAAHANEIYLHPMGSVGVKGLSSDRLYYGDLLQFFGVNIHVFKAGAYKSYPESFTQNAPSKEWLEAESAWLSDAWKSLRFDMEQSRGLMPSSIDRFIAQLPALVAKADGNMGQTALNANLIDGTKTFDETKKLLEEKLSKGQKNKYNYLSVYDYPLLNIPNGTEPVAVLVAEGEIHEGLSEPGIIGSETLVEEINSLKENPHVKAVVLRVNSPGGSAVASEMIRDALEHLKQAGKPVVVSMGDMAASGGYWISMGGSEIMASPVTITGSIGVFGLAPTFEKTLQLAKIGRGSVATTWLASAEKATGPMDPRLESILTQSVARTYRDFTNLVSQSRHLPLLQVQKVAQGRVWTGNQAQNMKLVDRLGEFEDALLRAKSLANLPADAGYYFVNSQTENLTSMLKSSLGRWSNPLSRIQAPALLEQSLDALNSPTVQGLLSGAPGVYAHSLIYLQP